MSDHRHLSLSDEQLDCAFDYFLHHDCLTNQMKDTSDDIGEMFNLLNQKQNDLQLAAEIGKALLERNRELDNRLVEAENHMASATETINQLEHTLGIKEKLLSIITNTTDTSEDEIKQLYNSHTPNPNQSYAFYASASSKQNEFETVYHNLNILKDEIMTLRNERSRGESVALRDSMTKLAEAVLYIRNTSDEQFKRSDALVKQQNLLNSALTRSRELENNLNQVGMANEMLASRVDELRCTNQNLRKDMRDVKDKYDEIISLFTHLQSEIRFGHRRSLRVSQVLAEDSNFDYHKYDSDTPTFRLTSSTDAKVISFAEEVQQLSRINTPVIENQNTSFTPASQLLHHNRIENEAFHKIKNLPFEIDETWDETNQTSSGFASASEPPIEPTESFNLCTTTCNQNNLDCKRESLTRAVVCCPDHDDSSFLEDDTISDLFPSFSLSSNVTNCVTSQSHCSHNMPMGNAMVPRRVQVTKQLHGSTVLERWRQLAQPSITSALSQPLMQRVVNRTSAIAQSSSIPANKSLNSNFNSAQCIQCPSCNQITVGASKEIFPIISTNNSSLQAATDPIPVESKSKGSQPVIQTSSTPFTPMYGDDNQCRDYEWSSRTLLSPGHLTFGASLFLCISIFAVPNVFDLMSTLKITLSDFRRSSVYLGLRQSDRDLMSTQSQVPTELSIEETLNFIITIALIYRL